MPDGSARGVLQPQVGQAQRLGDLRSRSAGGHRRVADRAALLGRRRPRRTAAVAGLGGAPGTAKPDRQRPHRRPAPLVSDASATWRARSQLTGPSAGCAVNICCSWLMNCCMAAGSLGSGVAAGHLESEGHVRHASHRTRSGRRCGHRPPSRIGARSAAPSRAGYARRNEPPCHHAAHRCRCCWPRSIAAGAARAGATTSSSMPGPTYNTLGTVRRQRRDHDHRRADDRRRPASCACSRSARSTTSTRYDVIKGWLDQDDAVVPREILIPPGQTQQQIDQEQRDEFQQSQTAGDHGRAAPRGLPGQRHRRQR